MNNYTVKPLNSDTWHSFEQLVQKHNGVWGGCWCIHFHQKPAGYQRGVEANRCYKKKLIDEDKTHACLIFTNDECIGWCQFGTPEELPNIYHKKQVESTTTLPDWRITCFFVDKDHRKKGVSAIALQGAVDLIKSLGGGVVESYPQDTEGKNISSSFLYNGTKHLFEQAGFTYEGKKGKNHCIMRMVV